MINTDVHAGTVRKTLNNYSLFVRLAKRKAFFFFCVSYKKSMETLLRVFQNCVRTNHRTLGTNVPRRDETKVELLGVSARCHVW